MIVVSREVFVCRCSTDVRADDPTATDQVKRVRFFRGSDADLARCESAHHSAEHVDELRQRLDRGEYWMVGELDGRIITYTWLHDRPRVDYPYLPGCAFRLGPDHGYGYDAWTVPELRGGGLRRRGFLEELRILRDVMGKAWEASYFVQYQLEGAKRSLGKVGIEIEPIWHVRLAPGRKLEMARLAPGDISPIAP